MRVKTRLGLERFEVEKSRFLSYFKTAENRAAGNLLVGCHRYTRISCASKLVWVQSDLKLKNLDFDVASNQLKIGQRVTYG